MKTDSSSARVTQHLRTLAEAGVPGARLPSVRALMADLRVSPVTIQKALDALVRDGVLDARPGLGTFVADRAAAEPAARPTSRQSLALGPAGRARGWPASSCCRRRPPARSTSPTCPEMQPAALLAAASARALRRPGVWGRMPAGLPALRSWFAGQTGGAYHPRG
jgi:DNA-binding transcriptional MocR family regulator